MTPRVTTTSALVRLEDASDLPRKSGEAVAIASRLLRRAVPFVPAFVVEAEAMRDMLSSRVEGGPDAKALLKAKPRLRAARAAKAAHGLARALLPDGLMSGLAEAFAALGGERVWVRPSYTAPPTEVAPLDASALSASSPEALATAVRALWVRALGPEALSASVDALRREPLAAVWLTPGPLPDVVVRTGGGVTEAVFGERAKLPHDFLSRIADAVLEPSLVHVATADGDARVVYVEPLPRTPTTTQVLLPVEASGPLHGAPSPLARAMLADLVTIEVAAALELAGVDATDPGRLVRETPLSIDLTALAARAGGLPGLSRASLGGVVTDPSDVARLAALLPEQGAFSLAVQAPRMFARVAASSRELSAQADAMEARVDAARRDRDEIDLAILPDDALTTSLARARSLASEVARWTGRALAVQMLFHLLVTALLKRSHPVSAARAAVMATRGGPSLSGVRLARDVADVAAAIDADARAASLLAAGALPDKGPAGQGIARLLAEHGHRAFGDRDPGVPRLAERPSDVAHLLLAVTRARPRRALPSTEVAATSAERALAPLPRVMRAIAAPAIDGARRSVLMFDRAHVAATRAVAMVREVVVEVDRRLRRVDPDLLPGAAFQCSLDELALALASGKPEVSHLVRWRGHEVQRPATFDVASRPMVVRGVGASPGTATGPVRWVTRPSDLSEVKPGDVLVARSAPVALAPLLLVASGIASADGGLHNPFATIARELGVPYVAAVPIDSLAEGELVRVDGESGVVERVGRP